MGRGALQEGGGPAMGGEGEEQDLAKEERTFVALGQARALSR